MLPSKKLEIIFRNFKIFFDLESAIEFRILDFVLLPSLKT